MSMYEHVKKEVIMIKLHDHTESRIMQPSQHCTPLFPTCLLSLAIRMKMIRKRLLSARSENTCQHVGTNA